MNEAFKEFIKDADVGSESEYLFVFPTAATRKAALLALFDTLNETGIENVGMNFILSNVYAGETVAMLRTAHGHLHRQLKGCNFHAVWIAADALDNLENKEAMAKELMALVR